MKDEKKELFYCVVEEVVLIDKEMERSGVLKNFKLEKYFNEDYIYVEVKNRKKWLVEDFLKLFDFINLKENSYCGSLEDEIGFVLEILGFYVWGV